MSRYSSDAWGNVRHRWGHAVQEAVVEDHRLALTPADLLATNLRARAGRTEARLCPRVFRRVVVP